MTATVPATRAVTPRGRAAELGRAAAAPLACGLALILLLAGWVSLGGAGRLVRVQVRVTTAAVPMPGFTAAAAAGQPAPAYLTIQNLTGNGDVLLSASSPAAARVVLTRRAGIAVPAHGSASLSPFGPDLVLIRPRRLEAGQMITLRLTFRHAGIVSVEAAVTAPGTP